MRIGASIAGERQATSARRIQAAERHQPPTSLTARYAKDVKPRIKNSCPDVFDLHDRTSGFGNSRRSGLGQEGFLLCKPRSGPLHRLGGCINPTATSILAGSDFAFLHQLELLLDTGFLLFAPRDESVGCGHGGASLSALDEKHETQSIGSRRERSGRGQNKHRASLGTGVVVFWEPSACR
jgi:hypothetical protein